MPLSLHGKRMIANAMYQKGVSFLGAAILLRQKGGHEYVVLHLLCQGLEIVLKAALLFRDYNRYRPQLVRPLGHDLSRTAEYACEAFGFRKLSPPLAAELAQLSKYYKPNHFRYGGVADIFINPTTIPRELVMRRALVVLRLFARSLRAGTML